MRCPVTERGSPGTVRESPVLAPSRFVVIDLDKKQKQPWSLHPCPCCVQPLCGLACGPSSWVRLCGLAGPPLRAHLSRAAISPQTEKWGGSRLPPAP